MITIIVYIYDIVSILNTGRHNEIYAYIIVMLKCLRENMFTCFLLNQMKILR